jgi:DeoR/GlpR family transcriptional regulator of sugar metabolism
MQNDLPAKKELKTYFETLETVNLPAKIAVARYIVDHFLQEGDSIILDAGTSLFPIAEEIARRATERPESLHFTIMTHNYRAFQVLVEMVPLGARLNVVLAGGRYDRDLNALFGPQTITAYDNFFPRVVLLGVSGLVAEVGVFCHGNTEELPVKEVIVNKETRDRIIVADYTKLGQLDAMRFGLTNNLLAGARRCLLVTDQPGQEATTYIRDRFFSQIEKLKKMYSIEVHFVAVVG